MATTDTRTGFRLPWSSDRNQDASASDETASTADEAIGDALPPEGASDQGGSMPDAADPGPSTAIAPTATQEPAMIAFDPSPAPAPAAPRKPSKLMVDLGAAIRATAEAARDQALAQVDADVAQVVEAIRSGSREGEDALRVRSDEDVAQIREWSRAEIARIKEETESRIAARKHGLDEELAAHAAAIEQRVGQVEGTAAAYRESMHAYADSLGSEDDPSRLATLAESMPEPPELEAWADLTSLAPVPEPVVIAPDDRMVEQLATDEPAEAVAATYEMDEPAEIPFENIVAALGGDRSMPESQPVTDEPEPVADEPEAAADEPEAAADEPEAVADEPEAVADEPEAVAEAPATVTAPSWGDSPELTMSDMPRSTADEDADDAPAAGDPVDRGALLAALEAAAAESTDEAEASETAAELLTGHVDPDEDMDPAAAAAMSARMDAGGFEESFADRLAFLMPSHGAADADGEPRTTQVIVSGLVSVASIASFKRHLSRLPGVQGVAVASGPAGEFVFNVTHRPDVSFRDAVPTMPGFAARVTNTADGVVHVTARDPEAEG